MIDEPTPTVGSVSPSGRIADLDRRLFGGFVEHLGRHVYDGLYEPEHPDADERGFRSDVIELVRELGVHTIRYPGGNFVSGYRWEDGVGPREQRPRRLDLAWHTTETNQVGLHEFQDWLDAVGARMMLAVNLGTRGVEEALDLLEYANSPADTDRTRERAANGRQKPFGVRMWCLGNEMDGPWQLGHCSADDYGKRAATTARAMRRLDPTLELVACGSSSRSMPTFGSWERVVLEHTLDLVDFISCHAYYQEHDGETQEFLASAVDMHRFIESVVATADQVAAAKKSDKQVMISFDEWNVWDQAAWGVIERAQGAHGWPEAPRQLEDLYRVVDAVVVGDLLITLLQHADRVRSASLAQLVNVIAPIMTEPGGPAWRQTTFFPFSITSRLAHGDAFGVRLLTGSFTSRRFGEVPDVNAVATQDADGFSLFLANRSTTRSHRVSIDASALVARWGPDVRCVEALLLHDADPFAVNTLADPDRVRPRPLSVAFTDGVVTADLPAISWAAVRLARTTWAESSRG